MRLGDFQKADANIQEAERLSTAYPSALSTEVAGGRGILELSHNKIIDAEQSFRQALRLAQQSEDKYGEAVARLNLAASALRQQHFDDAVDWSNTSFAIAQSIDADLTEEKALGNLGWAYYKMGDFNRAQQYYLDARQRAHDLSIPIDEARWIHNLGAIYYATNQPAIAEQHFLDAYNLAKILGNPEQMKDALSSLAMVSIKQKKWDAAGEYSQNVYGLAQKSDDRGMELYALFTRAQVEIQKNNIKQAEGTFLEIVKDEKTDPSLRWRAQGELARIYEQQGQFNTARQYYKNALRTVACSRGSLQHVEFRLPFLANATGVYDDFLRFLVEHGQSSDALRIADDSRAKTLAEGLGRLPQNGECAIQTETVVAPQKVAANAKGTVLFYWLGEEQSYLWIITTNRIVLTKLPPAAEINALVQKYRKSLLGPRDALESNDSAGSALYKILIDPAKPFMAQGSRVVIVPDQSLNDLNFETLLVPAAKPHYWIEDAIISYASSLKMLSGKQSMTGNSSRRLLLIGDPIVPDPKYPPLAEAATEMEQIAANFPARTVQVYKREAATPVSYLTSKPEQYSYIHFVAHGTASQISPLDSAIVLSKATTEEDSFKLHARDIIEHPLHAELVTISACYGSGSTIYDGEGLVGLSWGFIRAGAHNVVGALWAVSDKSTSQLMGKFYEEIGHGRRPEEALREAKLSFLHSDTIFRKPIYWAPFQFYVGS